MNEQRRLRLQWLRLNGVIGLSVVALIAAPMERVTAEPAMAPRPPCGQRCVLVEVTRAADEMYSPKVILTGSIEPKFSSNIAFRTSGRIEQRFANVGDHVEPDRSWGGSMRASRPPISTPPRPSCCRRRPC